ncbi:MAG TPA: LexA family transcriptional regulator [Novosphingobium sp.]|nr:LexA family transcriptional regulator [Novosphingobium sp.]
METPDPRRRLLELAEGRGVSLSGLSRMIGKNASYLQQFVRKGSPRRLEELDRGRLARFFGVDERELGKTEEISFAKWIDVPRLAVGASAGAGALSDDGAAFDTIRFSSRWLRSMGLDPERLTVIAVTGDSMEPALRDGDEILVDRTARPLHDGIHVVRLGDTLLVKRIETGRGGAITLLSDNPAYRPIECVLSEVAVIGRVVWKGGRL